MIFRFDDLSAGSKIICSARFRAAKFLLFGHAAIKIDFKSEVGSVFFKKIITCESIKL